MATLGVLLLAGCQSYPWTYRPDQRVSRTRIAEVVLQSSHTDILFVIDNSGSMAEEHANLVANTKVFIEELAQSDNNYRVGVVTTDLQNAADSGRLRFRRATAGELNAAGCAVGLSDASTTYMERPDLDDPELSAKRCRLIEDFVSTVGSLGTGGDGREAGLWAARYAIDPALGLNADFLRDDADLAIIFLSDEDDCSYDDYSVLGAGNAGCYEAMDVAVRPGVFVSFFADLKGGVTKVRAAAIIGGVAYGQEAGSFSPRGCHLDGMAASDGCGCWSATDDDFFCEWLVDFGHPCPQISPCHGRSTCAATPGSSCDTPRCDALPGTRYHDLIEDLHRERVKVGFSGGTFEDSICRGTFGETLLTIARTVVLSNCFELDVPAHSPEEVELYLRREETPGEFVETLISRFDPDSESACQDCAECPERAWRMTSPTMICLECGLKKQAGDSYVLTVINEVSGEF